METMHFITCISLLFTLILTIINETSSQPIFDDFDRYIQRPIESIGDFDDDYYVTYSRERPARRSDSSSIENLKRGYYYIDNGSITPVRPEVETERQRRQDNSPANLPSGVKFTPLVRYKQTKTKRKKLFVPNFFG